MSASREAISRASIRTATSSPAGSRLPERDEASSASQSLLAPAAGGTYPAVARSGPGTSLSVVPRGSSRPGGNTSRALYGAGADGRPGRSASDHRYGSIV